MYSGRQQTQTTK